MSSSSKFLLLTLQNVLKPLLLRRTKAMKDSKGAPLVPLPPRDVQVTSIEKDPCCHSAAVPSLVTP